MLLKLLDELLVSTQARALCRSPSVETTPLPWVPLLARYRKILLTSSVMSVDRGSVNTLMLALSGSTPTPT